MIQLQYVGLWLYLNPCTGTFDLSSKEYNRSVGEKIQNTILKRCL
jgi:hypothetical protein